MILHAVALAPAIRITILIPSKSKPAICMTGNTVQPWPISRQQAAQTRVFTQLGIMAYRDQSKRSIVTDDYGLS